MVKSCFHIPLVINNVNRSDLCKKAVLEYMQTKTSVILIKCSVYLATVQALG